MWVYSQVAKGGNWCTPSWQQILSTVSNTGRGTETCWWDYMSTGEYNFSLTTCSYALWHITTVHLSRILVSKTVFHVKGQHPMHVNAISSQYGIMFENVHKHMTYSALQQSLVQVRSFTQTIYMLKTIQMNNAIYKKIRTSVHDMFLCADFWMIDGTCHYEHPSRQQAFSTNDNVQLEEYFRFCAIVISGCVMPQIKHFIPELCSNVWI